MKMKCPKCGATGDPSVAFDYKHPVLVCSEEPYETAWHAWSVWMCYACGVYFVSKEEVK